MVDHPFIRLARKHGAIWVPTSPLDGWIAWKGFWMPVRIIDRELRRDFNDAQTEFVEACRRAGAPFLTWRTESDVIFCLGSKHRP